MFCLTSVCVCVLDLYWTLNYYQNLKRSSDISARPVHQTHSYVNFLSRDISCNRICSDKFKFYQVKLVVYNGRRWEMRFDSLISDRLVCNQMSSELYKLEGVTVLKIDVKNMVLTANRKSDIITIKLDTKGRPSCQRKLNTKRKNMATVRCVIYVMPN